MLDQLAKQKPAVRQVPAEDLGGMRCQIERLAAGARMGAHEPLRHRRQHILFAEQQLGETELGPRPCDVMQGDEVLDLGCCRGGQRVVGGAQIGEFGLALAERPRTRHPMRVEHR